MALSEVSRLIVVSGDVHDNPGSFIGLAFPLVTELFDEVQALVDTGRYERAGEPEVTELTELPDPCGHVRLYRVVIPVRPHRTLRGRAAARKAAEGVQE